MCTVQQSYPRYISNSLQYWSRLIIFPIVWNSTFTKLHAKKSIIVPIFKYIISTLYELSCYYTHCFCLVFKIGTHKIIIYILYLTTYIYYIKKITMKMFLLGIYYIILMCVNLNIYLLQRIINYNNHCRIMG